MKIQGLGFRVQRVCEDSFLLEDLVMGSMETLAESRHKCTASDSLSHMFDPSKNSGAFVLR